MDALEPQVIDQLIEEAVSRYIDSDVWDESMAKEKETRELLAQASNEWDIIKEMLKGDDDA